MRTLLKLGMIVLPGLLGFAVVIVVSQGILRHYRVQPAASPIAPASSLLPRGPLISLQTNHDEYQNVTKGKVLLVFLTTDCDACQKEISNVSQALPSLASKVAVYGVGVEDRDEVTAFAERSHMDFPILLDHRAVILGRLGFKFMPTKVLLQDGVIAKMWYGSSPDKTALIRDVGEVEVK